MSMTEEILGNRAIATLTRSFQRPPHRIHRVHEADAELIDLGEESPYYLALTMDALVEEVQSGLYDDPYMVGWMLATVNFSDLAAVGADPLGLLVSISYSSEEKEEFLSMVTRGISDACREVDSFVLGGDTNRAERLTLSGCAAGLVPREAFVTRMGMSPGEKLYLTGPAGSGSIFALGRFLEADLLGSEFIYRPVARIKEGRIIRQSASCCMDTSDGVIHTVDTLMRLNHCQIILHDDWDRVLHPTALEVSRAQNIPPWLFLAGVHGEFELCFSVRIEEEETLLEAMSGAKLQAVPLGEVGEGKGVVIRTEGKDVPIDTAYIRNLSETTGFDERKYISSLLETGRIVGIP